MSPHGKRKPKMVEVMLACGHWHVITYEELQRYQKESGVMPCRLCYEEKQEKNPEKNQQEE